MNHGVPGTALAPSGLSYNPENDTLYIVDGNARPSRGFPSRLGNSQATASRVKGDHFGGIAGKAAGVVYSGAPLAAPISAALLFNGNLVVGNTTNNRLVEIDLAARKVVHTVNLDSGAPGALFGIAVAGNSAANTQIFFNDDNANAVWVLQH